MVEFPLRAMGVKRTDAFSRWNSDNFYVKRMPLPEVCGSWLTAKSNRELFVSAPVFSFGRRVKLLRNVSCVDFTHISQAQVSLDCQKVCWVFPVPKLVATGRIRSTM